MKQTMLLKLAPTPEQAQALLDTMHTFNAACNSLAAQAFASRVANTFELQKMTYGELRTTSHLPAQLAIRAISKTSEVYKRDKSIQPTFKPEGALVYDERVPLDTFGPRACPVPARKLSSVPYGEHQRASRLALPPWNILSGRDA